MDIQILLEEFCAYSLSIRGYSQGTIRRYRFAITAFTRFIKTTDLSQVTQEKVRWVFLYGRNERKWTPTTYRAYYHTLTVFFRWCQKLGYLKEDLLKDIELPKMQQRLKSGLTQDDASRLLETAYNYPHQHHYLRCRNHAIFAMLIFTGVRRQELVNLKYTDVDIDNLSVFVRQGKGAKDRVIPMNFTLAQSLKRYLQERKRLNKINSEFFSSLHGNQGFTVDGLRWLIIHMRKATGIRFSPHTLRHTFATLMLEGGCDIYNLSRLMGHNHIMVTAMYLSASAKLLQSEMQKHPLGSIKYSD